MSLPLLFPLFFLLAVVGVGIGMLFNIKPFGSKRGETLSDLMPVF